MPFDAAKSLPALKADLAERIVLRLRKVAGVNAVVLGGSHARGVAGPDSDVDLGIYYQPESPFAVTDIRAVAEEFSTDAARPIVTGFNEWGPWVNGGAWIQTAAGKVDFIYRNIGYVREAIAEAQRGVWRHDYDQQPPYGFRSVIYLAETRICVPLYDADGCLEELKQQVAEYPPELKRRIVQDSLWGAEFTLAAGRASAVTGDVYCAAGCATRVAQYLTQALFALNDEYFIGDKRASSLIERMEQHPKNYEQRMFSILANPGRTAELLRRCFDSLAQVWHEVVDLAAGLYQPRYKL